VCSRSQTGTGEKSDLEQGGPREWLGVLGGGGLGKKGGESKFWRLLGRKKKNINKGKMGGLMGLFPQRRPKIQKRKKKWKTAIFLDGRRR